MSDPKGRKERRGGRGRGGGGDKEQKPTEEEEVKISPPKEEEEQAGAVGGVEAAKGEFLLYWSTNNLDRLSLELFSVTQHVWRTFIV